MPPPRRRAVPLAVQFLNLGKNPICEGTGELSADQLVWRYNCNPTPMSRDYSVRILLRVNDRPKVYIDQPDLVELAGGRRIPHVYEQRPTRLCLYLPKAFEWQSDMRLDQTIVPWVTLWLFYFEEWLSSGEWKGGGEHPPPEPDRKKKRKNSETRPYSEAST